MVLDNQNSQDSSTSMQTALIVTGMILGLAVLCVVFVIARAQKLLKESPLTPSHRSFIVTGSDLNLEFDEQFEYGSLLQYHHLRAELQYKLWKSDPRGTEEFPRSRRALQVSVYIYADPNDASKEYQKLSQDEWEAEWRWEWTRIREKTALSLYSDAAESIQVHRLEAINEDSALSIIALQENVVYRVMLLDATSNSEREIVALVAEKVRLIQESSEFDAPVDSSVS